MALRWVVRLLMLIALLPFAFLVVQGCKPACAAGRFVTEDVDLGDLLKQSEKDKELAKGPKKPRSNEADGGVNPRGGGGNPRIGGGKCPPGKDAGNGKNSKMFGANGQQTPGSITVYNGTTSGYSYRIDVENLKPGVRPGTLHLQIDKPAKYEKYKYEYNPADGKFYDRLTGDQPPRAVRDHVANSDKARSKINVGLRRLGEL
ncbi:hypothetical protein GCM10028864_67120 [Microlunatus parietis]|nr:hypothetical protein [Microlunatus parietis]